MPVILLVILAGPITGASAGPQTLILEQGIDAYEGCEDNSIYADRPGNTNGGHAYIYSGATVGSMRRALIRFDLSAVPPGSVVLSAQLRLNLDYSGLEAGEADLYTLHRLTSAWGEGTVDSGDPGGQGAAARPGDATWTYNFFSQSWWTAPGGDFISNPSATLPIARWDSVVPANNLYTFDSAALATDVAAWAANPASNFGWILIGVEDGSRNSRRFTSSEGTEGLRPRLTITYLMPAEVAALLLAHLLGFSADPSGLDTNADGFIDVADLLSSYPIPAGIPYAQHTGQSPKRRAKVKTRTQKSPSKAF